MQKAMVALLFAASLVGVRTAHLLSEQGSAQETVARAARRRRAAVDPHVKEAMMDNAQTKAPWHLWVVGSIAVLFNSIGVFDFVMSRAKGADYMASAGMTAAQVAHYLAMPAWMIVVWAVGVFGAFLASLMLLLRSALALPVFVVSLVALLVSLVYTHVLTDGGAIMGRSMAVTSAVIAVLLVGFSWYAWIMSTRRVLR